MNNKTARLSYSLMLAGMIAAVPMATAATSPEPQQTKAPQQKSVTGQVLDELGEPVIGASILVEGTTTGTVTDLDGNFELPNVAVGAKLQISYVGYTTVHMTATAGKMVIKLEPDNQILEETIVIGYGVQKKSNVTGAISSVKSDDLKNNVNANAAQSLQGKVSGVQVVNASGAPGAAPQIRVRGYSSNGSSDPLYIVDGLKVSDISYLDPASIESMEILKDAASAAIYGAEAGNGVVLITTNAGKKGTTKITADASWSFQTLAKKVDVLDASEYKKFMTEAHGEGFDLLYNTYYANHKNVDTDWQDEMYETGTMQKYNVGLQGGNDMGKFFLSMGSMNNDGMLVTNRDYYKRITGQINASYNLRPWLDVSTSNTIAYTRSRGMTESNAQYGFMKDMLIADPVTPVAYTSLSQAPEVYQQAVANGLNVTHDGDTYYALSPFTSAPMRSLMGTSDDSKVNGITQFFVNGMTSLNFKPFKNFIFTSRLGYTLGNFTQKGYESAHWSSLTSSPTANNQEPALNSEQHTTHYYQWENFFNYTLETKNMGNWAIMGGMSYSDKSRDYTYASTNKLTNYSDNFLYLSYSTVDADDHVDGNLLQQRQIAYYGRLSWDFLGRYNAQFNFRSDSYDAAYLDLDHNWGFFPSGSIGWTFSQENFMKNLTEKGILSYGKFRASYGVNGSISNLRNYMYASILRTGSAGAFMGYTLAPMTYVMNGHMYQTTYPSSLQANPKLRWERSNQLDLGLDLRWFNDRLTTTFDYYHKLTDGLLIQSVAQLTTGCSFVYQNLGKVTNQGFEAEVEWRDRIGKDFKYSVKANIATVSNKVSEYKGEGTRIGGSAMQGAGTMTYFEEGYPIWYIRGYEVDHIDKETGSVIYKDHDGVAGITDADRTNLGSAIPDFTYGITLNMSYKNFDLSIFGTGSQGNKLIYGLMSANSAYDNRPTFLTEGRWQKPGDVASMPSATQQINDKTFYNSDAFVQDASFFKIKQIQLGYNLPKQWVKKLTMENLRLYASLDNFFTFTKYKGADPEASAAMGAASSMAFDYGAYPAAKTFSFGVNLAF